METHTKKNQQILNLFRDCKTPESIYTRLIELGKKQAPLKEDEKVESNLVAGCQSQLWLVTEIKGGKVYFKAFADAFISAGLAALLVQFYSGMAARDILTIPPSFLDELNIPSSLTPSRANGLYHIHLRMKQEAVKGCL